jgi:hypothetical protein
MLPVARCLAAGAAALVVGALGTGSAMGSAGSPRPSDAYSPPVRIDDPASAVYADAAVAVNAAGDAVAVWDSGFGPGWDIYGARRPAGGSWSAPVLLTSDYGGETNVAALTPDGTAYFNALNRDDDGDRILKWAPDGTVSETGIGGHDDTGKVLADTHGDVVAYTVNGNHAITYAYALAGAQSWTSTTTINFFGTSTVALGPNHTYYVAYASNTDTGPGNPLVLAVRKVDGLTGKSTRVVRRKVCRMGALSDISAFRPFDIGASRSGAAVLTWRCKSRTEASINALRINAAGSASVPRQLARSRRAHVGSRLSPPRVAFDGRRATIVFSRAIGHGRRNVLATSSVTAAHWTRPSIKAGRVHPARDPGMEGNLVATPNGAALYTYRNGVALFGIRRAPGGTFGSPALLYRTSDLHIAQPGAITPSGSATVLQLIRNTRLRARTGPL